MRITVQFGERIQAVLEGTHADLRWRCDRLPQMAQRLQEETPDWLRNVPAHPGDVEEDVARQAAALYGGRIVKVEGAPERRTDSPPPPPGTVL